ncbi:hypothetical protein Pan97_28200 [Bremerella volcania]|uniref:Uncharacterized protein n=1 Tax=Bremerella volcania TaxID=2527984 RepID=A0A518C974_9BACT|nr:hypothetical protein Pan97_28200 [Bremerella volcania]
MAFKGKIPNNMSKIRLTCVNWECKLISFKCSRVDKTTELHIFAAESSLLCLVLALKLTPSDG